MIWIVARVRFDRVLRYRPTAGIGRAVEVSGRGYGIIGCESKRRMSYAYYHMTLAEA